MNEIINIGKLSRALLLFSFRTMWHPVQEGAGVFGVFSLGSERIQAPRVIYLCVWNEETWGRRDMGVD